VQLVVNFLVTYKEERRMRRTRRRRRRRRRAVIFSSWEGNRGPGTK